MKQLLAAVLLLLAILPSHAASNREVEDQGKSLFLAHDWAGFNIAATRYLRTKERTSAGFSSLQMLYSGISEACPSSPTDSAWDEFEAMTDKWLAAYGSSSSAAVVAAAIVRLCHGQKWRGALYFDKIPEDRRALFIASVERAREILASHAKVGMRDPGWYAQAIWAETLIGQDKDLILKLADQGLRLDSHFMAIYFGARQAFSEKWGGSPELMQRFFEIARSHEDGRDGAFWYARIAYVDTRSNGWDETERHGIEWTKVQKSYDDILAAYPDPSNLNNYAAMACSVRDQGALRDLFKRLGDRVDSRNWFRRPEFLEECKDFAESTPAVIGTKP